MLAQPVKYFLCTLLFANDVDELTRWVRFFQDINAQLSDDKVLLVGAALMRTIIMSLILRSN